MKNLDNIAATALVTIQHTDHGHVIARWVDMPGLPGEIDIADKFMVDAYKTCDMPNGATGVLVQEEIDGEYLLAGVVMD